MRKLMVIAVIIAMVLLFHNSATASTVKNAGDLVFETTGWIVNTDAITYPVLANVAPYEYLVKLSDLSQAPYFGFNFLYLSITTATTFIDEIVWPGVPGSFTFTAKPGETYFVNVFGVGAGQYLTGLFGVEITAVPIPPAALLLGSGLFGLILVRRRKR